MISCNHFVLKIVGHLLLLQVFSVILVGKHGCTTHEIVIAVTEG